MADNFHKVPFGQSINRIATTRARDAIQLLGKALPASVVSRVGMIVKVKFEVNSVFTLPNVVCPLAGSEYFRAPLQPGCQGVVFPADAYLGGMSGLGGGVADLTLHANLSTLVFFPIGNTGFQAADPNVATLYGPNGVTLQENAGASTFKLTPNSITLSVAGNTVVMNSSGVTINGVFVVTISGLVILNNRQFMSHFHTDPQGGVTGGVV